MLPDSSRARGVTERRISTPVEPPLGMSLERGLLDGELDDVRSHSCGPRLLDGELDDVRSHSCGAPIWGF